MVSSRFGSAAVETLIFRLATDPDRGILNTPVGNRIHKSPVPPDYETPYMTFLRRGAQDTGPVGRGMPVVTSILTYEVKGVDIGFDTTAIEEAADIMDFLLDGTSEAVFVDGNWYDISVTRTSELQVELPPEEDGTVYQHLGGIYDFYVSRIG